MLATSVALRGSAGIERERRKEGKRSAGSDLATSRCDQQTVYQLSSAPSHIGPHGSSAALRRSGAI